MGEVVEAPAASSTTVEMEAAEQLIQLSGGGESESKSVDSVKAGDKVPAVESKSADSVMAGEKRGDGKERVPAVESKSADSVMAAEKRGDGKERVPAVESSAGKRCEKLGAAKGGGEYEEAVIGGVARRRPRFRSLAAIYRETRRMDDHGHCREEAEEEQRSKGKKKKKKKWATDGEGDGEAIHGAAPCKVKRAVRRRTSECTM